MSQYMSVEIEASSIADLMTNDGNFAIEMWDEFAERIQAGAMNDDVLDIAGDLSSAKALFLAEAFAKLSRSFIDGYNRANDCQIKIGESG
jgi:hypothetical protein